MLDHVNIYLHEVVSQWPCHQTTSEKRRKQLQGHKNVPCKYFPWRSYEILRCNIAYFVITCKKLGVYQETSSRRRTRPCYLSQHIFYVFGYNCFWAKYLFEFSVSFVNFPSITKQSVNEHCVFSFVSEIILIQDSILYKKKETTL